MNRPGPITYLFGNPGIALTALLLALVFTYEGFVGQASPLIALAAWVGAFYCSRAYERLDKYRLWKLEWDAMDGQPRRAGLLQRAARNTALRMIGAGLLWFWMASEALSISNQPGREFAVGLFFIGTLVLIAGGVFRVGWRVWRSRGRRVARDIPVTLCLRPFRQSPSVREAFAALPEFCLLLLTAPR